MSEPDTIVTADKDTLGVTALRPDQQRLYSALHPELEISVQTAPWAYVSHVREYLLSQLRDPEVDTIFSLRIVCSDPPEKSGVVTPDMSRPPELWDGMVNCNQILVNGGTKILTDDFKAKPNDYVAPVLGQITNVLLSEKIAPHLPHDFDMLSKEPAHQNFITSGRIATLNSVLCSQIVQHLALRVSVDADANTSQWLQYVPDTEESLKKLTDIFRDMAIARWASMDIDESFLEAIGDDNQFMVSGTVLYHRIPTPSEDGSPAYLLQSYGMMIRIGSSPKSQRFMIAVDEN